MKYQYIQYICRAHNTSLFKKFYKFVDAICFSCAKNVFSLTFQLFDYSLKNTSCHWKYQCITHPSHWQGHFTQYPHILRNHLIYVILFAKSHELTFNTKKTYCICTKPIWLKNITVPTLYLAGQIIDVTTDHKYLGMFFIWCEKRCEKRRMWYKKTDKRYIY